MLAHEIRTQYLQFFQERGHLPLPGASLIPVNALGVLDEATLFTGSGMEQFKPYFANSATPPSRRVTTVQKCIRTNDIDEVGDATHCTFFEMLGNFSFGDYFKADVIPWTWEFLTKIVGLEPERLCVTIYVEDDEAFALWHNTIGLPAERIHRQGEDKNFWPASVLSKGPNGPCGPNSEIFYRVAPESELTNDPALSVGERFRIDEEAGKWVEIWNNVFTQFNRQEDAEGHPVLTPLPSQNNDTGAGLDRIAYVSQGKTSVFETDLFGPTLDAIARLSGMEYEGSSHPRDVAMRVVAEHTRAAVFCIADGILPSNEGRGYVLRYILRRAVRFGKMTLGFDAPFLHRVAPEIIAQMGDFYTELRERQDLILQTIKGEEEAFGRRLDVGMTILDEMLASGTTQQTGRLSGADVFLLHGTYGFPYNLTQELAKERGIAIDMEGFERELEQERERSRGGSSLERDVFSASVTQGIVGSDLPRTEFRGYEDTRVETSVVALYVGGEAVPTARVGDTVTVVLASTPFYAESGGQVGDAGTLTTPTGTVAVSDTKKNPYGVFLHSGQVTTGEIHAGQSVDARIDAPRRLSIMRNHTATHLLQAALRQVLGGHVNQKGSQVSPERLRFDFTHGQPMTVEEIARVESLVNEEALRDAPVRIYADVPIAEAKARGAMALFGEKYGNSVRMVEIPDFSLELCGGTHLTHTSQVGLFKIVSESGVAAGVRRIEAVTGAGAYAYVNRREETLTQLAGLLKSTPNDTVSAAERLLTQRQQLERELKQLKAGGGIAQTAELTPRDVNGVAVVVSRVEGLDGEALANLADATAQRLQSAVVLLGTEHEGKVLFAAKVTKDLVQRGLHAGNLVRQVAKMTGGGGGGRPDFATAGGRDASKLPDALAAVPELVAAQIRA